MAAAQHRPAAFASASACTCETQGPPSRPTSYFTGSASTILGQCWCSPHMQAMMLNTAGGAHLDNIERIDNESGYNRCPPSRNTPFLECQLI